MGLKPWAPPYLVMPGQPTFAYADEYHAWAAQQASKRKRQRKAAA